MDDSKDLIDIVTFIKNKMVTKDDLDFALAPIKDDITVLKEDMSAIKSKLSGIDNRIDREAGRGFEHNVRLQKLESR